MEKSSAKSILRSFGVIKMFDSLRYQLVKFRNKADNDKFKNKNPDVVFPPDYLMYESHILNYRSYFENGRSDAEILKNHFEKHISLKDKKVLDWGCGPARVIRHFPELLKETAFYGTDYNKKSISWNIENIKKVNFFNNTINPPTSFKENTFDAIYGMSIFTHLSKENHTNWINELYRIANQEAVLIITTHGEAFKEKLIKKDQLLFEDNKLVIEANTLEGHRTFAAYHPPKKMHELFKNKFAVLEHIPGKKEDWGIPQDIWILKKL